MKKTFMSLQLLILLFALLIVPASADSAAPSLPLILDGDIEIADEPAPVGTQIIVKLNDVVVGSTVVTSEGVYGDNPQNKLYITALPGDYANLKFYVDGVESTLVDQDALKTAGPGAMIESTLVAPVAGTPASSDTGSSSAGSSSSGSSSGSSGFSSPAEVSGSVSEVDSDGSAEEEPVPEEPLMSTGTEQPVASEDEVPAQESRSSIGSIGLLAVGLLILIGTIATVKYRSKR